MKTFEYKTLTIPALTLTPQLNELGSEGWEVISVSDMIINPDPHHNFHNVLLKREVVEDSRSLLLG